MEKADSVQPLSAYAYTAITLVGFIFAVSFTVFYIYQVPKLGESGVQGQIFYLLLIPWALSSAAFLFGAMKSYARLSNKHLGSFLELGGPVVVFFLVVGAGLKLIPPLPETFDLTVRAHSADGRDPIITSGQLMIDLGNDRRTAPIGANGEANFKGIPSRLQNEVLEILPRVDGYEERWMAKRANKNIVELSLVRTQSVTHLIGSIVPPPNDGDKEIRVVVDGQPAEAVPDALGRFEIDVNGKSDERIRLKVYSKRKLIYDEYQTLPGPVTLLLGSGEPR
jgi:hypothetical protein